VKAILRPPFPFFDIGERGGYAHALGECRSATTAGGRVGRRLSALSACRPGGRSSDGAVVAPVWPVVAADRLLA